MINKTVFITGANRGIGKAILSEFAHMKIARIYAHSRKESNEFSLFMDSIKQEYHTNIIPVYFDLTDEVKMKEVLKPIIISKESVDILINNAGILHSAMFFETPMSKIKEVFDVNLFSQMSLTQFILKKMLRQKSGSIINISSISALDMAPRNVAYAASKAAMISWTKTMAAELGRLGIRCNAVAPGLIDTDMLKTHTKEELEYFDRMVTLQRVGTPEDVAKVVKFLASDEAAYLNGQVLRIDGGIF